MSLTLLFPPAAEPVTLQDLKDHLRVDGDAEGGFIAAALASAVRAIEARSGLALMTQGWRLALDAPPEAPLIFPIAPVQSVDTLTVSGAAVSPSAYEFAPGSPGRLRVAAPWPAPANRIGDVVIDFTAGFGVAGDVPSPLIQAVKMLAAHFYENREAAGEARVYAVPRAVDALIAPWRELRL
jgi:uncharacterized phiE125 gp8 family phage protein